jgi:hypothetical protein
MSIFKRPNQPRKIVLMYELTSRHDIPDRVVDEYGKDRDLDKLRKANSGEPLVEWTVYPLIADHEYLTDEPNSSSLYELVRLHVTAVHGESFEFEQYEGRQIMTKESVKQLPMDVVGEIAGVVIQSASNHWGKRLPFVPQRTWRNERIRSRSISLSASIAPTGESANDTQQTQD